ncbi:MAG TPA: DUF1552 domain-containing protein [Gemmataceae bacterium]|nr:DUF1552 domain-containing protein [Gemmataceae bacterium]
MPQALISRRTVLRGLGAVVALPWLEAMAPLNALASTPAARSAPNRLAFLYVPNGVHMPAWKPQEDGPLGELPDILKPLAPVKDQLLVVSGLTADKARPHGDGPGDHARALGAFLTGAQPRKTDGYNIRAGVSADQVAAARVGGETRLPSLEIGCEAGAMAGNCDSGYSCVYSSTISWRSATQPLPKEVNPKLVFERLFGAGKDSDRAKRDARRKSVLDFVREDAGDLRTRLGATDQRKLDEYFTAVRDIEQRIARAEKLPDVKVPDGARPSGTPAKFDEHLRLMCDLMVLAFQTDVTRVCTFVLCNEGSNRPYGFIGVPEGHHDLSHHGRDPKKQAKIKQINTFHIQQFAYLLTKLKGIKEGDSTLLDHCMLAYGSGNSDGDRHNHDDLPVLVAGRGSGTIKSGRHMRLPREKDTPVSNLWLSLLDRMSIQVDAFGDATGRLRGLEG